MGLERRRRFALKDPVTILGDRLWDLGKVTTYGIEGIQKQATLRCALLVEELSV